ncbi:MAG: transposase domain-containing protein [Candidatus Thiodiazotropha sp.]
MFGEICCMCPPKGFTRIRHYESLAGCSRTLRLAQIRQALTQPVPTEQATSKDSENPIPHFTLDCKNWLIAGYPRGASASTFIYSLIESAKANGLEPKRYLNELFERYPLAVTDEQLAA